MPKKNKIIVTGGAGFVGSNLIEAFTSYTSGLSVESLICIEGTPKMQDRETQEQEAQWERERRGDYTEPSAAGASYEDLSEGRSKSFNDPDITPSSSTDDDDTGLAPVVLNQR